jgi:probable F420-dependent oxidoreductase
MGYPHERGTGKAEMMQFGAFLPTYWDDYGTAGVRTAIEEAAKAADALGYDSVWANDLVAVPAAHARGARVIEPLITLASLIHLAPRVRLGTSVLVLPQRNAFLVAKQAAALDLLSGGRLLLGVGVGHREAEFRLLGADFAHRGDVTGEAIEVLRALWREPVASHHGRFYRFDGARMLPKPAHGGPPIWIGSGGASPRALRRVARYGSAWLPFVIDLDTFREDVATLRDLTRGRPCPLIAKVFHFRIRRPGEPADGPPRNPGPRSFPGSPDAVADHLAEYRQAGMEYAVCAFDSEDVDDLLRQLRLFAEEVAPRFAATA